MKMTTRKVLCVAAAASLWMGSAAAADGLGIEATQGPIATGQAGAFVLQISNDRAEAIHDLRWFGATGYVFDCASQTNGGRGFGVQASLQAGDRVRCTMVPSDARAPARTAAVVVSARAADGSALVGHAAMSLLGGATPSQGIVVVVGGAVHTDSDLDGVLDAGETIAYDYTLVNAGTEALSALVLGDLSGVVSCPATTLAVAASLTCTRSYAITATDATAGLVLNEVEVTGAASNGDAVQAADVLLTLNNAGAAAIRVFKSPLLLNDADGSGYASAFDVLGYTFVVKNSNAQPLTSVNLVEPDPTLIDGPITCAATTLGGQGFAGLGSGALGSNDVVLCSATHTITLAEASTGEALNLVEASGLAAIGGPVSATGASAVGIPASPQIGVSKTVDSEFAAPGSSVRYTITVSNLGSTAIPGVVIDDPVPAGLDAFAWSCVGSGVACPSASGSGAILETVPLFPAGAQIVYSVSAVVAINAPSTILNTVTVTPQTNVLCLPGSTPPPCSAVVPLGTGGPIAVPLGGRTLLLLVIALALIGSMRLRRRPG